jgi:hypothetical protein
VSDKSKQLIQQLVDQLTPEQNKLFLQVVDAFIAKRDEYKEEARRCRKLAKAVLRADGREGVLVEISQKKRMLGVVICAPGLDDKNLAPAVIDILRELDAEGAKNLSPDDVEILGTERDK